LSWRYYTGKRPQSVLRLRYRAVRRQVWQNVVIPAHSLSEALKKAEEVLHNPQADIAVIPDGIAVIVKQ
jgi:nickel-dependent lactate racemase